MGLKNLLQDPATTKSMPVKKKLKQTTTTDLDTGKLHHRRGSVLNIASKQPQEEAEIDIDDIELENEMNSPDYSMIRTAINAELPAEEDENPQEKRSTKDIRRKYGASAYSSNLSQGVPVKRRPIDEYIDTEHDEPDEDENSEEKSKFGQ